MEQSSNTTIGIMLIVFIGLACAVAVYTGGNVAASSVLPSNIVKVSKNCQGIVRDVLGQMHKGDTKTISPQEFEEMMGKIRGCQERQEASK